MADFNQMGGLPTGYADLLNAARQQLVRLPDGTYVQAPQFGSATSVNDVYQGIIPPSVPSPLKTRSVPTYDVDNAGAPIIAQAPGFVAPPMSVTRSEQAGLRPAVTAGTQPAGTVAMPPGARPASVDRAFAQMQVPLPGMFGRSVGNTVWDPFGTQVAKDETRLPTNDGGESGFMAAFYPNAQPSAVSAIDQATVPLPRMRPIPPAMTPLTAFTAPDMPMPRNRPTPPMPSGYTIQQGDNLETLARRFGTTVNQLANANGISNPNRIRAGATLNLGYLAPPVPRMPPATLGRGYGKPKETRAERFANLDEFGMIR